MSPVFRLRRRTIPSLVGLFAIVGLAVPSAGVQAFAARSAAPNPESILANAASPSFTYDRHDGNAFGEGWPEGAIVTLSVDGGEAIETFPNPDLAQHWVAWEIGAQPGQTITATDGTISKNLSVTSVEVTEIDEPNDIIRGSGPAGATVLVGPDGELPVTVLEDGTWTADLATAGIELRPGDDGYAAIDDNDGDSTRWWWHVPNPTFFVDPVQDMIQFMVDWTPGGLIDVTIDGADAPGSPFTFEGDGGNIEFAQFDIDLHAGTVVVATDRTTGMVHQHTVRNLTVDRLTTQWGGGTLDPNGGIVSGTADPTTDVVVGIYWPEWARANETVTTGTGINWSADTNLEAFDYVGLQPGFGGYVVIWDDDGDGTQINWRVLDPRITVDPLSEQLWADEFASNAPVTLTVDGTAAPGGPYSTDDWGSLYVALDPNQLDLATGDVVEFSDGVVTKQLVLAALTVAADEEHLTMSGSTNAPDDTYVNVSLGSAWRDALVTSGAWAADFGLEPDPGTGDGTLTVFGGNSHGAAQVWDDDGDSTQVNFQSPYIHVSPFDGYVFGDNWAPGEPVTVMVDSVPVDPAPIPDESGHLEFELTTTPGNAVTASQNGWIAHVVVQSLEITAVNEPTDGIVSGIAPDGALVDVHAWTADGSFASRVTTAADGTFTVDFSTPGDEQSWGPDPVTLGPGTQLRAHLYNDRDGQDHDATHHDYFLPAAYDASMHVIVGHPDGSNVLAVNWPEGAQLHLTVERYDEFDNLQTVFEKDTVVDQPDPSGNITQAWFDPDFAIERHDIVTITGGGYTTTHQVTDITFDAVDADNDIVSGSGAWYDPVCVDIWMWPDDPATACASPDEFGNWAIDFSGIYDLDTSTVMGVFDRDEGGATQVDWRMPLEPQISVWMGQRPDERGQMVTGENWPEGQPVTIEIDDPDTTQSSDPDYENEATPNGNGYVDFYPNEDEFVIEPGFTVTMSDGTTTRSHVVTRVVATATDPEADQVHGSAEPGSMVTVGIWGPFPYREVNAGNDEDDGVLDGLGPWTADFSIPQGDQPAIDLIADPGCPIPAPAPCAPFMGEAWQADGDGDMTRSQWWVPGPVDPIVQAYVTEEFFRGEGFTPDSSATVSLYDTDGTTPLIDHQGIGTDGGGSFWYGDPGIEQGLLPGMVLEVTDDASGITKVLQLVELRFDAFDPIADVVTGFAPQRPLAGEIRLHLTDQDGNPLDDGTGYPMALFPATDTWSFDLNDHAATSPDYPDYDPSGLLEARVEVPDEDGDGTFGQLPQVRGSAQFGYVNSDHFDSDPFVEVEIYRDDGGSPVQVFTLGPVETSQRGEFHVDSQVGLQPDDVIVVTGLTTGVVKSLVIGEITLDGFDIDNDVISGSAPPLATVEVNVGNEWCGSGMRVPADGLGDWFADFSTQPGCGPEPFDITDDMGAQAVLLDHDMDATVAEWFVPEPPWFQVARDGDFVQAHSWLNGPVDVTIDSDDVPGDELYEITVDEIDPDGYFRLDLQGEFDIQAGQFVTLTDGVDTKTLLVTELTVTAINPDTDTVSGVAEPFGTVHVETNGVMIGDLTADEFGTWTADASGLSDIAPGTSGWASEVDEDGDETQVEWRLPAPPEFGVTATHDWVEGFDFEGDTITVTFDDNEIPGDGVLYEETFGIDPGSYNWNHIIDGFDIQAGQFVTVTDGITTKTTQVSEIEFTYVDNTSWTLYGVATPGIQVETIFGFHPSFGGFGDQVAVTDEFGNWELQLDVAIDPADRPATIPEGTVFGAGQFDQDRDRTFTLWDPALVEGHVLVDGQPVVGATVWFQNTVGADRTCTDGDGYFSFDASVLLSLIRPGIAATGVAPANPDVVCDNPQFTDDDGKPLLKVLLVGPFDLQDGYEYFGFDVEHAAATQSVFVDRFTSDPSQCPVGRWVCWVPQNAVMVQAFDLGDPEIQEVIEFGGYEALWNAGPEGLATTIEFTGGLDGSPDGTVELRYPTVSDHLVMIRYFDAELLDYVYLVQISPAGVFVDRGDGVLVGPQLSFRLWDEINEPSQQAEAALELLIGLSSTDQRVTKAIEELEDALDPAYWVDEHSLAEQGDEVFKALSKAVKELDKVTDPSPEIEAAVAALVDAARTLAHVEVGLAIDLYPTLSGKDQKMVDKAVEELQKGAEEEGRDKYDKAIDHYGNAWSKAYDALDG